AVPPLTEGTTQQTRQDATPPLPVRPLQQENTATADAVPAPSVQQAVAPAAPEKTDTAAAGASQVRRKSADIDSTGTDRNATGNTAENQTAEKPRVYTVQIGAFKSSAEAKQLKVKFEKKGYKPFISAVKDRNGNKIYKIKTGEFADRKDAEVLALKLKKTEGLHTYVTTTSE
ncbi:MAG TPA: SPOR domain-containing protein, partial [Thermodesulfovibrionales bacterium]|nr:SPOR domain-containing protein [Thermodesulfovibrionales bacterium]